MARKPSITREETQRLMARALSGERAALARILSNIERDGENAKVIDEAIFGKAGTAYSIGITGAPGAGKSTLLGSLLAHVAKLGERAAVLAVDPSSPITRGALLGDRLRMQAVAADKNVFVRSMASRGRSGGLADMTRRAARCLEACGWPWVFIETVGIGQVDVDVSTVADVVIVVLNPGAGDEVQAFKAGLMEVADIFVINKADHPAVEGLRHDLAGMIASIPPGCAKPAVVETVATTGQGVAQLWSAIGDNLCNCERSGELSARREKRLAREIIETMNGIMTRRLAKLASSDLFDELKSEVVAGRRSLQSAAMRLLGEWERAQEDTPRSAGHFANHFHGASQ